jgi:PAS domain S-box-containing protein
MKNHELARGYLKPDIFVVARVDNEESEAKLKRAGADRTMSPYGVGGRRLAMMTLKSLVVDFVDTRKDGEIINVSMSFSTFNKNDLSQGIAMSLIDITERKRVEDRLEQAAEEWRATFDSITDLISIHDKDNRIIRVNKAVADMLKTTPKDLVGKFCHEVMHGTKEPPVGCPHLEAIKTGKPTVMEAYNLNIEVYFHESSSPLFNEKGEVTGSIVVARDITQQKRIEEQLILADRLASIGELSSGIAHELNNPLTSVIGFSQLLIEGDVPDDIKEDLSIVYSEAQRAASMLKIS